MTKWRYVGDEELVFPTLAIIVKNGDVFEGPADLTVNGLIEDTKTETAKSKAPVTAETELGVQNGDSE
jgi:ABC-type uncharacterized transport system substrate-binding protein